MAAKTRGMFVAQAPVALPGDHVDAENARCRPPRWESGVVTHVTADVEGPKTLRWSYRVLIDRDSGWIVRHVGDDGIELVKRAAASSRQEKGQP